MAALEDRDGDADAGKEIPVSRLTGLVVLVSAVAVVFLLAAALIDVLVFVLAAGG